jgi:hypothetical protein
MALNRIIHIFMTNKIKKVIKPKNSQSFWQGGLQKLQLASLPHMIKAPLDASTHWCSRGNHFLTNCHWERCNAKLWLRSCFLPLVRRICVLVSRMAGWSQLNCSILLTFYSDLVWHLPSSSKMQSIGKVKLVLNYWDYSCISVMAKTY